MADTAALLGVLESSGPDPNDPATRTCQRPDRGDYTRFLRAGGLKGARIGIPRAYFYERYEVPTLVGGAGGRGGLNPSESQVMADTIAVLKHEGAIVVDPADIPSVVDRDPKNHFALWSICSGADRTKGHDEDCSVVLKYGMKRDFNKWLASSGRRRL